MLVAAAVGRLPASILLVAGGLALGFVPGLPHLTLPPDLVLVAILPPLLYSAAFFTGLRDLRANLRPISLLAIGLVAVTTIGVAMVAHAAIGGLSWAGAFTLGAIVSPTDALAATEVARRVGAPRRVVSIIEGESLVNDGIALVLYKTAVAAAVAGTFSLWDASWHLVVNVIGGIAVGLAVGWVVRQVRRRVDDTPTEVAIALLSGYLAYLPAAALGVSGVLAAVTIGVYMGWYTPQLTNVRDAALGQRVLGDPRLPRQRAALRAGRPSAARHPRPAERDRLADRRRRVRDGRGDRAAHRLGADLHVRPAASCSAACASVTRTHRGRRRR